MRKLRIDIDEMVVYQRSMVVAVPDAMDDDEIDSLLDKAELEADTAFDVGVILERYGVKVLEYPDDSLSSPSDTEVEIIDAVEVKAQSPEGGK